MPGAEGRWRRRRREESWRPTPWRASCWTSSRRCGTSSRGAPALTTAASTTREAKAFLPVAAWTAARRTSRLRWLLLTRLAPQLNSETPVNWKPSSQIWTKS